MYHIGAWTTWALSAAVLALSTRNPLYLSLIVLLCWIVQLALGERGADPGSWRGLLKLGALVWLVTIPLNALMIHEGSHVLFRLPERLPLVGGPITLEAVLAGAVAGLSLWTVLLVFATYNTAVDATDLLRSLPPAFLQVGTVASIALTFVPQMLSSAQEIREAQQVRGHRFRGWRDWPPLFMPLLATSFEHAMQLAESMEARGFGGVRDNDAVSNPWAERLLMLGGLVAVLMGMLVRSFWPGAAGLGMVLLIVGILVVAQGLREVGRGYSRSRYRRARWTGAEIAACLAAIVAVAVPLWLRTSDKLVLAYYPYPPYPLAPAFDLRIGLAFVMLVAPALIEVANWTPRISYTDRASETP